MRTTTSTPRPRRTKRPRANSENLDLIIERVIKGVDSTLDSKFASRFNSQMDTGNGCLDVELLIEKIVERIVPKLDTLIDAKLQQLGLGPTTQPIDNRLSQRLFGQPPFYSQQQQQVNFSSLTKFIHSSIINQETIVNKSKRAVIEKFPEEKDATEFIKAVAEGCGVVDMLEEDIHRHPRIQKTNGNNDNNNRARIIKVPFKTMAARDKFLKNFSSFVRNMKNSPVGIKARRDMTPGELQILYDLRKEAYERNKSENLFKFVVHDLTLYELKNPKPLKTFTKH